MNEWIKVWRKNLQLTQGELSEMTSIATNDISRYERGLCSPRLDRALALRVAFDDHKMRISNTRQKLKNLNRTYSTTRIARALNMDEEVIEGYANKTLTPDLDTIKMIEQLDKTI